MDIHKARKAANDKELDLVEVAPQANPPVCKILDYGKYRYELAKKHTTKQKTVTVKEVKVRPAINDHDLEFKMRNARKFLGQGNKVKLTVFFRGREIVHKENGKKVLDRVIEELSDVSSVEQFAKMEGNRMIMILGPAKSDK